MSTYRRSKFTFGDYGASNTPTYHAGPLTSSAASLTRTNYAPPITSLVNGSASGIGIVASSAANVFTSSVGSSRYTPAGSAYSSPKLTGSLSSRAGPTSSVVTSTFTTRSPRLQSYLSARDMDSKTSSSKTSGLTSGYRSSSSWRSNRTEVGSSAIGEPTGIGSGSSRSRSYSHSYGTGRHGEETLYRGRSTSSIRDTSPYDSERDRDLVMTMRSQSAMSSRATSRDRERDRIISSSYTSGSAFMEEPSLLASTSYARQLTSDMNSLNTRQLTAASAPVDPLLTGGVALSSAGQSQQPSMKKYGSDDSWSETNWLNNLRVSAGMDPIPMPSSNISKSLAYEAISTLPRVARSNSSHDLRDLEMTARAQGYGPLKSNTTDRRPRHQTLAYGVNAADLTGSRGNINPAALAEISGSRGNINPAALAEISGYQNGTDADFLVTRVPSREGEIYDVRGFESDMSAAIMNARVSSVS